MKIFFLNWNSYGSEDIKEAFEKEGASLFLYPFSKSVPRRDPETETALNSAIENEKPDFVFSFNYFPIVSTVCERLNVKYISFVYDSPHVVLYSYTVLNKCNEIFLFDSAEYNKFARSGIKTMHYLPLCANPDRISRLISDSKTAFRSDITFVGALYTEKERYVRNLTTSPDGIETKEWLYEEYVKNRILTGAERINLINKAAEIPGKTVTLFTHGKKEEICRESAFEILNGGASDTLLIPGISKNVHVMPPCHPDKEAPIVYNHSNVNLCITLKSIHSGVPLRAFEIMASKGLLLMNHQKDMDDIFTEGEDYLMYKSEWDFDKKIKEALNRDNTPMIERAFDKLKENHTYRNRVREMFKYV